MKNLNLHRNCNFFYFVYNHVFNGLRFFLCIFYKNAVADVQNGFLTDKIF